jgi:preprotein translocase subunit SecG
VLGVGLVLIILALVLMQSSQGTDFIGSAGRAGRARFQAMRKNNAE